jgi:hypothetical protein
VAIWITVSIRNIRLIKLLREKEKEELSKKNKSALPYVGWNLLSSNNLIGILFPFAFLCAWVFILLN